jgi:hypothetical protein
MTGRRLIAPNVVPKTSTTPPSAHADPAWGGSDRLNASSAPAATVTGALPNRWQSRPVSTIVTTAPAEMPSRARPSAGSVGAPGRTPGVEDRPQCV